MKVYGTVTLIPQLLYTGASDFVDKQTEDVEYEYNANGALIKDLNRGITNIEYDLLGNPTTITMKNRRSIRYVYSADGRRLRTVHSTPLWPDVAPFPLEGGSHGVSNAMSSTVSTSGGFGPIGPISPIDHVLGVDSTEYVDNFLFRNGHLHQYHFDGGYISFSADTIDGFHYYIQDYMGNNRMVVNGRTDSIEQVTHYYPYGGVIGDISTNESLQPYKFEGKELDRTFGLDNYDIEARQYFAMAPMWDRPDKLAENDYGMSPYVYCDGDPVNKGDYDGKMPFLVTGAIGAVIGAGVSAAASYISGGSSEEIKNAALAGAAGGFIAGSGAGLIAAAGLTVSATTAASAIVGGMSSGVEQATNDYLNTGVVDVKRTAGAVFIGAVTSKAGCLSESVTSEVVKKVETSAGKTFKSNVAKEVKRLTNLQESGGTIGGSNTSSRSTLRTKKGIERTATRHVEQYNNQNKNWIKRNVQQGVSAAEPINKVINTGANNYVNREKK